MWYLSYSGFGTNGEINNRYYSSIIVRKGRDSSVLVHGQVVNIHEYVCACM